MTRRAGAAGVVCALLLALAGCGGDDDDAATTSTTEPTSTSTSEVAGDEVVDEPVDGFTERSVAFANLTYTVTGVRVTNQDLRSYAEGTDAEPGDTTHLVLDVEVENATGRQLESDGDAIALEIDDRTIGLADPFLTDAAGFIRANSAVEAFLAFELDDGAAVEDAVLVLGVAPDRRARLPITGPVDESGFPLDVTATGTADGTGPTNGGTIAFELLGGTVDIDLPHGDTTSPTGERADEGEIFVQLHMQATKTEGRGNDVLSPDAFRLVVDGTSRSPFDVAVAPEGSTPTPTAEPGATVDAWVLFAVDAGAATYQLLVGDQDESPGAIEVELPT